jgi:hypothetical protein
MATDNPYAGTPNESQWQAGYDSGIASPGGIPSAPLVLESDQSAIWSEGALAGYTDGQQQGFQTPLNPPHGEQPDSIGKAIVEGVDTGGEAAMTIYELWKMARLIGTGAFELGSLPISVFLLLLSLESPPLPTIDEAMQDALLAKCTEIGQNELFAAMCRNSDHSSTGDAFFDNGFWHGALNFGFWPAYQEAVTHFSQHTDAVGNVGIAHYVAPSPDTFEFVILQ